MEEKPLRMILDINLRPLHACAHTNACVPTLIYKHMYASMQTHMRIENEKQIDFLMVSS